MSVACVGFLYSIATIIIWGWSIGLSTVYIEGVCNSESVIGGSMALISL